MSVSTSISNTNQLYPNSSSDGQWNPETSNVNQPNETQFLVADQQFVHNSLNCNGSSAIYNAPKITNVSNFNCINGQLFNSPGYVGTGSSSVPNGQNIRFQTEYNGLNNPGMMIQSVCDGHIALRNNTWPGPVLNRDRLISRPTWNSAKPSGGVKKTKRIRTAFTSQQMMELENEYVRTRYLDRSRRIELSEILKLNERTIKIWFQNRRMKEKKVKTENIDDTEATSTTESTLDIDNRQMIMYDPYPHNGVYNRNIYVEQYPVVSPGMSLQETGATSLVGSVETLPMNSYSTFVVDNNLQMPEFDMQYRQMNMQMQEYSINDKNEALESNEVTLEDSSHQSENSTNDASKNGGDDENWDLSWIRSIHIDEEI